VRERVYLKQGKRAGNRRPEAVCLSGEKKERAGRNEAKGETEVAKRGFLLFYSLQGTGGERDPFERHGGKVTLQYGRGK